MYVTIDAFARAYGAESGIGTTPPLPDTVLTIHPSSPWSSSHGTNVAHPLITPKRWTSSDHLQSLFSCSHTLPNAVLAMPALLHTTWTAP